MSARLYGVSGSLWLDEFSTLWCVEAGWHSVAPRVASFQGQSPLYYFLVRLSVDSFGETEIALRLPSLVASVGTSVLCAATAGLLTGKRAAVWAGLLSWLAFSQVQTGVNARPYGLAILAVAGMTAGFVAATGNRSRWWRVGFIVSAVFAFWAHFVFVVPILGLVAAHALYPELRRNYGRLALIADLLVIAALCAPTSQFLEAAISRPQHINWLPEARHGDTAALLAPFLLPLTLAATMPRSERWPPAARALLMSVAGVIVCLELGLVAGVNLVTARYLGSIIVPISILTALGLERLGKPERVIAGVAFVTLTLASYGRTFLSTGSFSGVGVEDWRTATATVRQRLTGTGRDLVLFRSGFVEEDLPPLGDPHPATRSPLRGPGQDPLPASIVSLTYSWSAPGRLVYFATVVRPRLEASDRLILLAQRANDIDGSYTDNVATWARAVYGKATIETVSDARGIDVRVVTRATRFR
jgi:uncharacterized membrane protein